MPGSKQHWLDRNRPPRVQITYDVETGDALEKKEIPFVVGVVSALSGDNDPSVRDEKVKLKDRKFVQIDRDSFNNVLASMEPKVAFAADNCLNPKDGPRLKVELSFKKIDDFRPENIIQQVPALRNLYLARTRLNDLLAKLEGNDEMNEEILKLIGDESKLLAVREATEPPPAPSS